MNKTSRFTNWRDVAALLVRWKWWALWPAAVLVTLTLMVAILLPSLYLSESLILIEPRDVPDDFVKDLISVDSDRRLNAIRETVLSRTNLLSVYRDYSEQLRELRRMNLDARLENLRSRIRITFERPDRRSPITYFRISFEDREPETAQLIAGRLAELFINYDNRTREQQVFGTGEFLDSEYQKVQKELDLVEEELAEVKRRYRYELPEQLETNLRTLDRLGEDRKTNAEALDRQISLRLTLERQISETPAVTTETIRTARSQAPARQVSPLLETYREKERALQDLTARYTDEHPDVRRARAEIEKLRAEIPAEDLLDIEESKSGIQSKTIPNPTYQQLVAQLQEVKTEISIREREKERIEAEIQLYSGRLARTPTRELEIAALQRRYEDLDRQAENLKGKLSETRLAESLESRQKGEQFQIVDPASLPLSPAKPNRLLIVLLGMVGSIAAGLALAFGRDLLDSRFWTHAEVERYFGRPLLIEIPQIMAPAEVRRARMAGRARAALFLVAVLACGASVFMIYNIPQLRDWSTQKLARVTALLDR